MRTQASNADKVLIESVIIKVTLGGKIVNKKNHQALTVFIIPQR